MPSIAEAIPPSPASGKKRRRDEGPAQVDAELQMKLSTSPHPKLYPADLRDDIYPSQSHSPRNVLSPKRRFYDSKRPRIGVGISSLECGTTGRDVFVSRESKPSCPDRPGGHKEMPKAAGGSVTAGGKIDLSPCHICRRKPTVKSELDAFGDCDFCGERTCYICTRRCEGPGEAVGDMVVEDPHERGLAGDGGHRDQICSGCCVEKGAEGEVWCLGCLRKED
ncbi:hypothetical protein PZA11_003431 [Diplocarpon coronariae]|nr:hypothetical protein JHW43_004936 [Diplocarpon mali]